MTDPGAALPALITHAGGAALLTALGEIIVEKAGRGARGRIAAALEAGPPPLLVHAPATWRWLGLSPRPALDLLELFAFVRPAEALVPTPRGLAAALDLTPWPAAPEAQPSVLGAAAAALLRGLAAARNVPRNRDAAALAAALGAAGWPWAPLVLAALGAPAARPAAEAVAIWRRLPEWQEAAPPPPPSAHPVGAAEARARLAEILGDAAEARPGQSDYAAAVTAAFAPRTARGAPHLMLAEAGTGIGKTLGYIAPASLWAARNHAPVWISTFTRHLQRQIETELTRLYPDRALRRLRSVVRKGRENYLCLLNFQDATTGLGGGALPVGLGLIARWALATEDGDIQGGDLPGWFAELFGQNFILALADRRGECIHAACPHWRRCFVEHAIRRSAEAELVVANHALVMSQAAYFWNWGEAHDDAPPPTRYVFDEGHHLFDAADAAFAVALSGLETAELRRWLLGAEGSRSRARGLRARLADMLAERPALESALEAALIAARALPAPGWAGRLAAGENLLGEHGNTAEAFFAALDHQIEARQREGPGGVSRGAVEVDLFPLDPAVAAAGEAFARALARLAAPLEKLRAGLAALLDEAAETLDSAMRTRIEAACRTLRRRALERLAAWREMLAALAASPPVPGTRPRHIQFLRRETFGERGVEVGLHRHWLDPTEPFAATLAAPAHGILITSATLCDAGAGDPVAAWEAAEARVGANYLPLPAIRAALPSPFDYATQTRVFVVDDLAIGDVAALAGAFRALFLAARGGALGLFTAIARLRAVHARLAPALAEAGIALYAQHVDALHNATLVDIFRAEEESCLLGTDAMRDGVDVPGQALRLVVFERVPWPRPDILHRERRIHLALGAPGAYDDRLARLRLRQAFGRLIRGHRDRGVFVLLDRRMPSRLYPAFPEGVPIRRAGLAAAVAATAEFLADPAP
uniref:ATP-dependent DNA helicase n=1 Tax=Acidicaldus sp. TaxID=1872105 RepID=A0A8J4M5C4_9PROT